jgi:hypothetical protein
MLLFIRLLKFLNGNIAIGFNVPAFEDYAVSAFSNRR